MTSLSRRPCIAAMVLTAGKSTRMGSNKLLAELNGRTLVAHTVEQVKASGVDEVVVVTGHMAAEVEAALAGSNVRVVHNSSYADGMATSIRTGIAAVQDFDAALICLGDMPLVTSADMARMITAFKANDESEIVAPTFEGRLGNPVLWGKTYFAELMTLEGDKGARRLLEAQYNQIVEVPIDHDGIMLDADTPEALDHIKQRLE
jgi:molybdenum cofactor cytidylyltransferase